MYYYTTPTQAQQLLRAHAPNDNDNNNRNQEQPTITGSRSALTEEAGRLLQQSRALREEIARQESARQKKSGTNNDDSPQQQAAVAGDTTRVVSSKWNVPAPLNDDTLDTTNSNNKYNDCTYRLYVDIGREEGTWMEPRWGASGRRIEFTLDVQFQQPGQVASEEASKLMVQDNNNRGGGSYSSPAYTLRSAPYARLRSGFDDMKCEGGAYRIDLNQKERPGQSDTVRFYVMLEGTRDSGNYGDVSIPQGCLYFSIPCFGGSVSRLSRKGEMPVTVRMYGWHTGWRRAESRIVGIFRAVPIQDATRRDGF